MTLILTLGNSDQFTQLSDRRLSVNGKLVDDEANKSGILVCANGRFAFGFTGIARYGAFKTQEWLTSSLAECGASDYQARGIIERLCVKATEDFKTHPALRVLLPLEKPLSIMFSGYLYHHQPPLAAYAIVTNHMKIAQPSQPEGYGE